MAAGRKALVVATYEYVDAGLRRLAAPQHDAESLAAVLEDPEIAGFDVTMLVNQPHHLVGEAIADFYADVRRDDLTLLYFTGHGLKDDEGRFYLAMTNTRRSALMFTAISGAQLNDAIDASPSRRKVLVLDCCFSGAFPAGRTAKADEGVQTLERFQGKGRAVLTASDATQYAFEGDDLQGSGTSSVFTRHLVEAIRTGAADLDEDGDIALDELYSYVRERVVAEVPQQRPKKQEDVDGRIVIARNVHWTLPAHLRHALDSPIAAQRLGAVEGLAHLHRVGNDVVRAAVAEKLAALAADDSRSVAAAADALRERLRSGGVESPETTATTVTAPPGVPDARTSRRREQPVSSSPPPVPAPAHPVGGPARRPASPATPVEDRAAPDAAPAGMPAPWLPVLLTLVLAGGVLSLLSRFLIFETTYTVVAADFGVHWISWLTGVGLPLLVGLQLLVVRGSALPAVALSGGLVAGAVLTQVDLVLATWTYWRTPESGELPGPGWWATLSSAVVLLGAVVVVLMHPVLHRRPGPRSDWRTFGGLFLVVAGLVAWLSALDEAAPWLSYNEPMLLLTAVCLPVVVLELDRPQRLFGLAVVTVLAPWVASGQVQALILGDFPVDAAASVVALSSALCCLAGCYLAQLGRGRHAAPPATEDRTARSRAGGAREPDDRARR